MRKNLAAKAAAFTVLFFLAFLAYPHDIWLFTKQFTLTRGDTLSVHQFAGSELEVEMELELLLGMTSRFQIISPDSTIDLLGEVSNRFDWIKPVLKRKLDFDGLALLVMDHHFIYTEFSQKKFLEYLEHEDFKVNKFQSQIGNKPTQSERYARSFKCLVQVGEDTGGEQHKQIVGQKLEILLLQNPYQLDPGDKLEVQVLFEGEPLSNKLVTSFNGDGNQLLSKSKSRTNKDGIACFRLKRKGFYLIRLVHLYPCSDPYTDWESHWSTYSFELD